MKRERQIAAEGLVEGLFIVQLDVPPLRKTTAAMLDVHQGDQLAYSIAEPHPRRLLSVDAYASLPAPVLGQPAEDPVLSSFSPAFVPGLAQHSTADDLDDLDEASPGEPLSGVPGAELDERYESAADNDTASVFSFASAAIGHLAIDDLLDEDTRPPHHSDPPGPSPAAYLSARVANSAALAQRAQQPQAGCAGGFSVEMEKERHLLYLGKLKDGFTADDAWMFATHEIRRRARGPKSRHGAEGLKPHHRAPSGAKSESAASKVPYKYDHARDGNKKMKRKAAAAAAAAAAATAQSSWEQAEPRLLAEIQTGVPYLSPIPVQLQLTQVQPDVQELVLTGTADDAWS